MKIMKSIILFIPILITGCMEKAKSVDYYYTHQKEMTFVNNFCQFGDIKKSDKPITEEDCENAKKAVNKVLWDHTIILDDEGNPID